MFINRIRVLFMPALLLAALAWPLGPASAAEEALTADQIVEKANLAAYYQGQDGRARVTFTIRDASGREQSREFVILRRNVKEGGDQRFYVHFQAPADVRRQAYLVWKHVDQDDDRWLYLPDLDLVKRVAAGDKRTSFVGSHFFYEDVSGRNVNADEHSILSSDERFYVLKNVPKDKDAVEFSWYKVYVDRKTFMPLKAIYYDKSAEPKPYRTAEAQEMQWIQDRLTVVKSRVQDQRTGGETVAQFSDVKYDLGLSDDLFSERYLRRPPKEARP